MAALLTGQEDWDITRDDLAKLNHMMILKQLEASKWQQVDNQSAKQKITGREWNTEHRNIRSHWDL